MVRGALVAVLLVVVAAVGVAVGLLTVGAGGAPVRGHAVPTGSGSAPLRAGSCFYADEPGSLRPTSCTGGDAVFVVNDAVPEPGDCARVADFSRYGAVQRDASSNAVYCVSLVLRAGQCVQLGRDTAPQRVECGSADGASRVARLVSSLNPAAACTDLRKADVWYYRSPSSGRLACLVPDGG